MSGTIIRNLFEIVRLFTECHPNSAIIPYLKIVKNNSLLLLAKKIPYQSIVFHPVTSLFSMEVLRWLIQSRDITQRLTIHQPGIEKMDGRFFLKTC